MKGGRLQRRSATRLPPCITGFSAARQRSVPSVQEASFAFPLPSTAYISGFSAACQPSAPSAREASFAFPLLSAAYISGFRCQLHQ